MQVIFDLYDIDASSVNGYYLTVDGVQKRVVATPGAATGDSNAYHKTGDSFGADSILGLNDTFKLTIKGSPIVFNTGSIDRIALTNTGVFQLNDASFYIKRRTGNPVGVTFDPANMAVNTDWNLIQSITPNTTNADMKDWSINMAYKVSGAISTEEIKTGFNTNNIAISGFYDFLSLQRNTTTDTRVYKSAETLRLTSVNSVDLISAEATTSTSTETLTSVKHIFNTTDFRIKNAIGTFNDLYSVVVTNGLYTHTFNTGDTRKITVTEGASNRLLVDATTFTNGTQFSSVNVHRHTMGAWTLKYTGGIFSVTNTAEDTLATGSVLQVEKINTKTIDFLTEAMGLNINGVRWLRHLTGSSASDNLFGGRVSGPVAGSFTVLADNVGFGPSVMGSVTNASRNTVLGAYSGSFVTGDDNVFIGYQSGKTTGANAVLHRNIVIGSKALSAYASNLSDTLWIQNDNTNRAIIAGDLVNRRLAVDFTIPGSGGVFAALKRSLTVGGSMEMMGKDGGLLINRMTTTERNAIGTKYDGELIYNSTSKIFEFWDGTQWLPVGAGASSTNTLSQVLNAGRQANNYIELGSNGNTTYFPYRTIRTVNAINYAADMAVEVAGAGPTATAYAVWSVSNGTTANNSALSLFAGAASFQYSPNNGLNRYDVYHTGNLQKPFQLFAETLSGSGAANTTALSNTSTYATATEGAAWTGQLLTFGGRSNGNFDVQFSSGYANNKLSFRSRNGDTNTWNPWLEVITSGVVDIDKIMRFRLLIGSSGNANNYTLPGYYGITGTSGNTNFPVADIGVLTQIGDVDSVQSAQMFIARSTTIPDLYFRSKTNTGPTFSNWAKVWHSGNFDPNNYAPITGGAGYIQNQTAADQTAGYRIAGIGIIVGAAGALVLRKNAATAGNLVLQFQSNTATQTGYVGFGSSTNDFYVVNSIGAGKMYLITNGINSMYIDGDKIGIGGITNPNNQLTLPNNKYIAWKNAAGTAETAAIRSDVSDNLILYNGSADRVTIDNAGLVGIGRLAASPNRLDVAGNIRGYTILNTLSDAQITTGTAGLIYTRLSNGNSLFAVGLTDTITGTANAGGNYNIWRYADAGGNPLGVAIKIIRASGVVTFETNPTVGANVIWNAGNDGPGSGLNADLVDGKHENDIIGNWGQQQVYTNGIADFNAITRFGGTFMFATAATTVANAPTGTIAGNQYYSWAYSIGSEYANASAGTGTYALQFAFQRVTGAPNVTNAAPYQYYRLKNNGVWDTWNKIWAGNSDLLGGFAEGAFARAGTRDSGTQDFNTFTDRTFLGSVVSSNTNSPVAGSIWWNLINVRHRNGSADGNLYGLQIANGMTSLNDDVYFRSQLSGTWRSWFKLWHSGNFDPTDYAPVTGGNNYIQNQFTAAQSATGWIANNFKVGQSASNVGYTMMVAGSTTNAGYTAYYNQSNVRTGYVGLNSTDLHVVATNTVTLFNESSSLYPVAIRSGSNPFGYLYVDGSGIGLTATNTHSTSSLIYMNRASNFIGFYTLGNLVGQVTNAGILTWNRDVVVNSSNVTVNTGTLTVNNGNSVVSNGNFLHNSRTNASIGIYAPNYAFSNYGGAAITTDPEFNTSSNGISVYNNTSGTGTVTITREADATAPNSSKYRIKISKTGTATPGAGGFTYGVYGIPNGLITVKLRASIPVGYSLSVATNNIGTGYFVTNYTPVEGTGKWTEYVWSWVCGNTGTFSTAGYVYITPTGSTPINEDVTWYLSSLQYYRSEVLSWADQVATNMTTGRPFKIWLNNENTAISQGGGNSLRIDTASGYTEIGPQNTQFSHFFTNTTNGYYFNKSINVDGSVVIYNQKTNLSATALQIFPDAASAQATTINSTGINTIAADGNGIRFWNGSTQYMIAMSSSANVTYGGNIGNMGTLPSPADYNIYYKITGNGRGHAFITGNNIISAQILNTGVYSIDGFFGRRLSTVSPVASTPGDWSIFEGSDASGANLRWRWLRSVAEAGTADGNNLLLQSFNNSGVLYATPFGINRTTSLVTMSGGAKMYSGAGQSGIYGTAVGLGNVAYFGFFDNALTRQGYIGIPSTSVYDLYLVSDVGNVRLATTGVGQLILTPTNLQYTGSLAVFNGNVNLAGMLTFTSAVSASNQQIDLQQGYGVWSDNTAAISGTTRLWIDTPNAGDVVIGPRNGSNYLSNVLIKANNIRFNASTSKWGSIILGTNSVGDVIDVSNNVISLGAQVAVANIDTITDSAFRTINYGGYTTTMLSWNAGGSTGPIQLETQYGATAMIRLRNKTDSTTWTDWRNLLHSGNHVGGSAFSMNFTGLVIPSVITTNATGHVTNITSRTLTAADISPIAIMNQANSAQTAQYWINGQGRASQFKFDSVGLIGKYAESPQTDQIVWTIGSSWTGTNNWYGIGYHYGAEVDGSTNVHQVTIGQNAVVGHRFDMGGSYKLSGWVRFGTDKTGIMSSVGSTYLYFDGSNYVHITAGGATSTGFVFRNGYNGTIRSYLYSDTSSNIGFLNSGGAWSFRVDNTNNAYLTGALQVNGDTTISGGSLTMNNGTSNTINLSSIGVAAPTVTTRSIGTKFVLYATTLSAQTEYAVGVETGHIWHSVATSVTTSGFKWYGGTTNIAKLDAVGNLWVNGNVGVGISSPEGKLHVIGQAYIGGGNTPLSNRLRIYSGTGGITLNGQSWNGTVWNTNDLYLEAPTTRITGTVQISGGTPATGKVLTSDNNGVAVWGLNNLQTVTANGATTNVAIVVSNNVTATGFFNSSRAELKIIFGEFESSGVDIIDRMKVKKFKYKNNLNENTTVGFVIEDIEKTYTESEQNLMINREKSSINQYSMLSIQTKAIQELSATNKKMEERIKYLEEKLSRLL